MDRNEQVRELFLGALDRLNTERQEYLREACAGDAGLCEEVCSLLDAYEHAPSVLDDAPLSPSALEPNPPPPDTEQHEALWTGRRAGAYRLIRPIGRGGMGVVWLGERADGQYQGNVAVKLVQGGDSNDLVRRFRFEQQALASLDHPYIARLLDAGTAEFGQPYLVMEYVEGRRIDLYCHERKLPVRARIELFLKVCEAVQNAHRNLVVHRDLKPSNILVDREGLPKLLDFGIAKLLRASEGPTDDRTETALWAFTPGYSSPEQLRGQPVTTASDVYSLGAILYELLTGQRVRAAGPLPATDEIGFLDVQPETPSKVIARLARDLPANPNGVSPPAESISAAHGVSQDRLRRILSGDLDMIALMALRAEPQRRYASVEQLAEDLRRHLDNRPIAARPDTRRYRAMKFVQRNKGLAASIAVGLVGLAATAVGTSVGMIRANRQTQIAKGVSDFFVRQFLEQVDPKRAQGRDITVREMLNKASEAVAEKTDLLPEAEGAIRKGLGSMFFELGDYPKAELHLQRSLELRRKALGEDHASTLQSLNDLGSLYNMQGRHHEAEPLLIRSWKHRERTLGKEHNDTLNAMQNLAALYQNASRLKEASDLLEQVLVLRRRVQGDDHRSTLAGMANLGLLYRTQGRFAEAEATLNGAWERLRRVDGEEGPITLACMSNLAGVLEKQGRVDLAAPLHERTLEARRRVLGEQHPQTFNSMHNLAFVYFAQGRDSEADSLARRAWEGLRQSLGDTHVQTLGSAALLARIGVKLGHDQEAEQLCEKVMTAARESLPAQHWQRGALLGVCGSVLTHLERFTDAQAALVESHDILNSVHGAAHDETIKTVRYLLDLYEASGDSEKAAAYRRTLELSEEKAR